MRSVHADEDKGSDRGAGALRRIEREHAVVRAPIDRRVQAVGIGVAEMHLPREERVCAWREARDGLWARHEDHGRRDVQHRRQ